MGLHVVCVSGMYPTRSRSDTADVYYRLQPRIP